MEHDFYEKRKAGDNEFSMVAGRLADLNY